MKANHTPTPWKCEKKTSGVAWNVYSDSAWIAECYMGYGQQTEHESKANAEFIVWACNAHKALLETCKNLLSVLDPYLSAQGGLIGCRDDSPCVVCQAKAVLASVEKV